MIRHAPIPLLLLLIAGLGGAAARGASPTGSLSGHVVDEKRRPIAAARLTITGPGAVGVYHGVTDATGLYRIPGLPTREPLVATAEAEGRIPLTYTGLTVKQDGTTRRDFRLRPQGWHDVLVILDDRIPYHRPALDGALSVLRGGSTILALTGARLRDTRALKRTLEERPNAVLAIGSEAAVLARREIRDVPVVYTMAIDPVGDDLSSVNLCGAPLNGAFDDQLAALAALTPQARRLVTIYDPRRLARTVGELRRAAAPRGFRLQAHPARRVRDVGKILASLEDGEFDAFFLLLDPFLMNQEAFDRIRRFSVRKEMILVVPDPSLVAAGGTFSYGPGFREMGAYAGRIVEHLFSGDDEPADIGRRFPAARNFAYSREEMERLGIVIPPEWTHRAPRGAPAGAAGAGSR